MHPIERLRWVARAPEGEVSLMAVEAADALASFAAEPAGLVIACRRLIERRPACGPLWWLASRVLCALDPGLEAHRAAEDLYRDPTAERLAAELPGGTVVLVGWPEQAARALGTTFGGPGREDRADRIIVVDDPDRESRRLVRRLRADAVDARAVEVSGTRKAARRASLVLLEAQALGPDRIVCTRGSAALAEAAREAGRPVWLVAGVGRPLPAALFDALLTRVTPGGPGTAPGSGAVDVLPLAAVDEVAGPGGLVAPRVAAARVRVPVASELLRFAG